MFFIFLMTALLGGFIAGRGFSDGDGGIAFLGLAILVVCSIAAGFAGFPA